MRITRGPAQACYSAERQLRTAERQLRTAKREQRTSERQQHTAVRQQRTSERPLPEFGAIFEIGFNFVIFMFKHERKYCEIK